MSDIPDAIQQIIQHVIAGFGWSVILAAVFAAIIAVGALAMMKNRQ